MDPTPDDPRLLEAALTITDGGELDAAAAPGALGNLGAIAEIAAAFATTHEARAAPESGPPALFVWGSLRVLRKLGEGGFGEVFAAWEPSLRREVALKLRRAQVGTLRWLDEARRLARIHHPNVLVVHGADLRDDRAGIWTELVRGRTLEAELDGRGPLPVEEALRIVRDIASALDAVHRGGIVHGDVTLRNLMLELPDPEPAEPAPARRTILMDFGSALERNDAAEPGLAVSATPLSAAPELLERGISTPASDLYSLGVAAFRLLTARYPVEAKTREELLERHRRGERVALAGARPGLPQRLVRLVDSLLAREPSARPASAAVVRDELTRLLGERVHRDRRLLWAVTTASVVVVALAWSIVQSVRARQDTKHYVPLPRPTLPVSLTPWWTAPFDSGAYARGWELDLGGDADGDGFDDLAVGTNVYSGDVSGAGRVELYRGSRAGLSPTLSWTYVGREAQQMVGTTVAWVGDVNGDGFDDLAEGEVGYSPRPGLSVGAVCVFAGGPRGLSPVPIDTLLGSQRDTFFGGVVVRAGDVNHDGFDDVLVTARNWSGTEGNEGHAQLYLGSRTGLAATPAWSYAGGRRDVRFGWGAAGLGDVDGDGYDDVAIGAPLWSQSKVERGAIFIFRGGASGLSPQPSQVILGENTADQIGISHTIVGLGDVNGDGRADIAYGVMGYDHDAADQGRVCVHLGATGGVSPRPVWSAQGFGSVCGMGAGIARGDVDGDGHTDLLVGGHGYARSADSLSVGMVALFRGDGRAFERSPAWCVFGDQPHAKLGIGLSVGDADGDRHVDIAVGQPHRVEGQDRRGRVMLFRGAGGAPPSSASRPAPATRTPLARGRASGSLIPRDGAKSRRTHGAR
jgi:hypothetical protein